MKQRASNRPSSSSPLPSFVTDYLKELKRVRNIDGEVIRINKVAYALKTDPTMPAILMRRGDFERGYDRLRYAKPFNNPFQYPSDEVANRIFDTGYSLKSRIHAFEIYVNYLFGVKEAVRDSHGVDIIREFSAVHDMMYPLPHTHAQQDEWVAVKTEKEMLKKARTLVAFYAYAKMS